MFTSCRDAVGAETARPFAVVIVGGLVSSTILTLIVLPIVCSLFLTARAPALDLDQVIPIKTAELIKS
jgi:Cu/Ag efflux pump CusA